MARSVWLSLLFVMLSLALVVTGRAFLDIRQTLHGSDLIAQIESLDGGPSSVQLADRVSEAAGCVRGFRAEVRSCRYVGADPSRPDHPMVVADRVRADAIREARLLTSFALVLWVLVALTTWRSGGCFPTLPGFIASRALTVLPPVAGGSQAPVAGR